MSVETRTALRWIAGLTLLWIMGAAFRPGTTFHLAPALVPLAPSLSSLAGARDDRHGRLVILGGGTALIVSWILDAAGLMSGPTLLPIGGALFESIVAAVGGTALGLVDARRVSRDQAGSRSVSS
jgi:hypothetical protein